MLWSRLEVDRRALEWVRGMHPAWEKAAESIRSKASVCLEPGEAHSLRGPCPAISAHNALLPKTDVCACRLRIRGLGRPGQDGLRLLLQPAVPVPWELLDMFMGRMWEAFPAGGGLRRRVAMVLPAHAFKWCCILLNDFLPVGSRRRAFAGLAEDEPRRKAEQLAKAQAALKRLGELAKVVG